MSVSIGTLAAYVTVAVAVAGGLSALLGHWVARRAASGRVATSEAAVLWDQAQHMRSELEAQRDKAVEQRDRLIDAYTQQVFPVLTQINGTVMPMASAMSELATDLRVVRLFLEGGGSREVPGSAAQAARADTG